MVNSNSGTASIVSVPIIDVMSTSAATFTVSAGGHFTNIIVTGVNPDTYNWTCEINMQFIYTSV